MTALGNTHRGVGTAGCNTAHQLRNAVVQFLLQDAGDRSTDDASRLAGDAAQVAGAFRERGDGDQTGVDAQVAAVFLVIAEVENLVFSGIGPLMPPNWFYGRNCAPGRRSCGRRDLCYAEIRIAQAMYCPRRT